MYSYSYEFNADVKGNNINRHQMRLFKPSDEVKQMFCINQLVHVLKVVL